MHLHLRNKTAEKKQSLRENILSRTTNILHLTHNDLDAAGSDAICRMVFGGEIFTLFSSVNRFGWFVAQIGSCNGKGDTLIISDLGYQNGIEDQIRKANAAGWRIWWYDHHAWTEEEMARIQPFVLSLVVDVSCCAAAVVCRAVAVGNAVAVEVARVICDYDLWEHKDPRSAVLGIVTSKRQNLELIRDKLAQGFLIDDEVSQIFAEIERDKDVCIQKSIRHAKLFCGKYMLAVMPAYGYPSETAAAARRELGCDMELLVFDTGKFSLRSVAPVSHLIARQFNGGGHPHASGGSFSYGWKERWMLKLFGRVACAKAFAAAADRV